VNTNFLSLTYQLFWSDSTRKIEHRSSVIRMQGRRPNHYTKQRGLLYLPKYSIPFNRMQLGGETHLREIVSTHPMIPPFFEDR